MSVGDYQNAVRCNALVSSTDSPGELDEGVCVEKYICTERPPANGLYTVSASSVYTMTYEASIASPRYPEAVFIPI